MNDTPSAPAKPEPHHPQAWGKVWRKFLRLTRGRIDVLRALEIIAAEEPPNSPIAPVLREMKSDITRGAALSDAMAKQDNLFSLSALELIRAAERTGDWDEIVRELADGLIEGTFT